MKKSNKHEQKHKRAMRVRKSLKGTGAKPRLCVNKTNQHIYLQLIDDENGITLGSCSTLAKELKGNDSIKKNKETGAVLGETIAKIASEKQISEVVFDRGSHRYHGILVELATAARNKGLKF